MAKARPKREQHHTVGFADIPSTYAALVAFLPPRPLRDKVDAANVAEMLAAMVGHKLNADQQDYVTLLAKLYAEWQAAHAPRRKTPPHELLAAIMEESGMTQAAMAKLLDVGQPLVSAMLSGKRELSKETIRRVATRFHLDPAAFL